MQDYELLDWLDQQVNLTIFTDDEGYWYVAKQGELHVTGYPFIREAIQVALENAKTN